MSRTARFVGATSAAMLCAISADSIVAEVTPTRAIHEGAA